MWDVTIGGTQKLVHHWTRCQTVFLYGKLNEEIYMNNPKASLPKRKAAKSCALLCALYGLKQAALQWWTKLEAFIQTLGFSLSILQCWSFYLQTSQQVTSDHPWFTSMMGCS